AFPAKPGGVQAFGRKLATPTADSRFAQLEHIEVYNLTFVLPERKALLAPLASGGQAEEVNAHSAFRRVCGVSPRLDVGNRGPDFDGFTIERRLQLRILAVDGLGLVIATRCLVLCRIIAPLVPSLVSRLLLGPSVLFATLCGGSSTVSIAFGLAAAERQQPDQPEPHQSNVF